MARDPEISINAVASLASHLVEGGTAKDPARGA